jgi:hypothetical protein
MEALSPFERKITEDRLLRDTSKAALYDLSHIAAVVAFTFIVSPV